MTLVSKPIFPVVRLKDVICLMVKCPTCAAAITQYCTLTTGRRRKTPHKDRRIIAKEKCQQQSRRG